MARTIIAQCTPVGSGSLAVLRLSGPQSLQIIDQIGQLASGAKISAQLANTVHYGAVIAPNIITAEQATPPIIDRVLFTIFRAPKSFTGEDTVEISCHNNQLIIQQIIDLALKHGASLAQRGEFSEQAFLNQKLDLTQAEALNELIQAQTAQTLKQSLAQLSGSFSHWLVQIEAQLLQALALCEASFEFLDEEMEFGPQISQIITQLTTDLQDLQLKFSQSQQLRTGIKIAIIGPPNAGKSSLFNALIQQERAIVTEIAGTTRDTIEAGWQLGDYLVTFVDTAGLRNATNTIEQMGITRSRQAAQLADIILLVFDSTRAWESYSAQELSEYQELLAQYQAKTLLVLNKCDIVTSAESPVRHSFSDGGRDVTDTSLTQLNSIPVSAHTGANLPQLAHAITTKIQTLFSANNSPFLLNQRHNTIINQLLAQLATITELLQQEQIAYELLAINLNHALVTLSEFTGKTISEQAMDQIFREFCVGK